MASNKVILVNEAAPYLKEFDGPAVRKHLRDFAAYQNRLGASEVSVSLCRTMDPEDLDSCIQTSEDMRGVKVLRRLPEGDANAKKRKKVLVNLSLMTPRKLDGLEEEEKKEEGKKSGEKNDRVLILEGEGDEVDDDAETVVEGDKEVLYLCRNDANSCFGTEDRVYCLGDFAKCENVEGTCLCEAQYCDKLCARLEGRSTVVQPQAAT